tara:strand:+ start:90 stop:1565 length:1476 start_codon:yes stop_codon:yes gene_type:complete
MLNIPKFQGVIAKKKNAVWCKQNSVICTSLNSFEPVVIDAMNLAHLVFSSTHLCLHERTSDAHLRAEIDAEVSNYILNQTSITSIYKTLDISAVLETFQHIFKKLRATGRQVVLCLDSNNTDGTSTPLLKPDIKELGNRQRLRTQYIGSRFRYQRKYPNKKSTRFFQGPDVNCPVLPRPISRIMVYAALQHNCEIYMTPGEADAFVALHANYINGIAISDDGDVFNFAKKTFLASECIHQFGPDWLSSGLKRYYNRYSRCDHCNGCYIQRDAMLIALREESNDESTIESINKLLKIDTSTLESNDLLKTAKRIHDITEYDKHISSTRFIGVSRNSNNSVSCGIRWDPPNQDGSDRDNESVMVITRILRWPFLEQIIDKSNINKVNEIVRYRLGDTERTVNKVDFNDIPMSIRKSVTNKDFRSFFNYIFPKSNQDSLSVYDVATKLACLWYHKHSLAKVALQHEFVHELLCAFPDRFVNNSQEIKYESFIPK